jgi:transposase
MVAVAQRGLSGAIKTMPGMGQNFRGSGREQVFLLPPDVRDWLAEGHFAWFVIDAVAQMDLAAFYAAYRQDGHGRAAFEPAMMVALLLYAYARGTRSSRLIERACEEDVAFRVIAAHQVPDHTTIARFRQRHQDALAALFGEVLALCAEAGLVDVGVIAVDATKLHANASERATCGYEQIAREILADADAVDADEDERLGDRRGDELPEQLATGAGRAKWLAEAKRRLEQRRAEEARPIPAARPARLREAKRRLEEDLATEVRANEAYEAYRTNGRMRNGRRLGAHSPPTPYRPPETPQGKINVTDPDSRNVKTPRGWVQGYNAQAVTTEAQIIIAAELTNSSADFGQLGPTVDAARRELAAAGVQQTPEVVLADAGYWHQVQMQALAADGIQVLVPPDANKRKGARPGWNGGLYAFMRRVLETPAGAQLYRRRQGMIEPVFADTKFNRNIDRFLRRGRAACRAEWRLITATHNLRKLHQHRLAAAGA